MEKDITYDTQDLENYFHFIAILALTYKNVKMAVDAPGLLRPFKVLSHPKGARGNDRHSTLQVLDSPANTRTYPCCSWA